jgi:hypothetical protein
MKRIIVVATAAAMTFTSGNALAAHGPKHGRAVPAATTTLKLDSGPGFEIEKTPTGKIEPKGNRNPKPGDSELSVYNDYAGTPANRGPIVGNDTSYCVVVKWPRGNCAYTIYYQGSLVTTAVSNTKLNVDQDPVTYRVEFADGVFVHVKHVTVSDIKGYPSDVEFTIPDTITTG